MKMQPKRHVPTCTTISIQSRAIAAFVAFSSISDALTITNDTHFLSRRVCNSAVLPLKTCLQNNQQKRQVSGFDQEGTALRIPSALRVNGCVTGIQETPGRLYLLLVSHRHVCHVL